MGSKTDGRNNSFILQSYIPGHVINKWNGGTNCQHYIHFCFTLFVCVHTWMYIQSLNLHRYSAHKMQAKLYSNFSIKKTSPKNCSTHSLQFSHPFVEGWHRGIKDVWIVQYCAIVRHHYHDLLPPSQVWECFQSRTRAGSDHTWGEVMTKDIAMPSVQISPGPLLPGSFHFGAEASVDRRAHLCATFFPNATNSINCPYQPLLHTLWARHPCSNLTNLIVLAMVIMRKAVVVAMENLGHLQQFSFITVHMLCTENIFPSVNHCKLALPIL